MRCPPLADNSANISIFQKRAANIYEKTSYITPYDWEQYLNFAKKYFKKR